jgi:predicted amidohydrolase
VKAGVAAFGEIGLTGRLRTAAQAERRLEECSKLGLSAVVAPAGTVAGSVAGKAGDARREDRGASGAAGSAGKIVVEAAETLRQAIKAGLDGDRSEGDD